MVENDLTKSKLTTFSINNSNSDSLISGSIQSPPTSTSDIPNPCMPSPTPCTTPGTTPTIASRTNYWVEQYEENIKKMIQLLQTYEKDL